MFTWIVFKIIIYSEQNVYYAGVDSVSPLTQLDCLDDIWMIMKCAKRIRIM